MKFALSLLVATATISRVEADPWNDVSWTTNSSAEFNTGSNTASGLNFDQGGCLNVHGHAVVLHAPTSSSGTRVGCGTIGQDPWLGVEAVADGGTANNVIKVP